MHVRNSSIEERRSEFSARAYAVLADRLDIDGLVARGWRQAQQSSAHYLAARVACSLSHACPPEVLLSNLPRRKLSPVTVERRAQALIELEQLWDRPCATEADALEAALQRRSLAIRAGLMTARKQAAMWAKMERRLAQLRKFAPGVN